MTQRRMSELVGKLFPASFVGSYPRPSWYEYNLGGRDLLEAFMDEDFAQAYCDGIRVIIGDQEDVGLDVLSDGHLWYDKHQGFISSFLLYNLERLDGIEIRPRLSENAVFARTSGMDTGVTDQLENTGMSEVFETFLTAEHAVVDKIGRGRLRHALQWRLAQRCTTTPVKAFFAMGPIELSTMLVDEHYRDRKAMLRDLAEVYRAEMLEAVAAGARIVELDDLIYTAPPEEWEFAVEILNRVFEGVDAYKIWHCCHGGTPAPVGMAPYEAMFPYVKELQVDSFDWSFAQTGFPESQLALFATDGFDKDLGLGVISNKNYVIESPQEVANGIRTAMKFVDPARIHLTSDCGLFAYSRPAARAKLRAMVKGAEIVRRELANG